MLAWERDNTEPSQAGRGRSLPTQGQITFPGEPYRSHLAALRRYCVVMVPGVLPYPPVCRHRQPDQRDMGDIRKIVSQQGGKAS